MPMKPTQPGWYWIRLGEKGEPGVIDVRQVPANTGPLSAFLYGSWILLTDGLMEKYEFAGPIEPPEGWGQ